MFLISSLTLMVARSGRQAAGRSRRGLTGADGAALTGEGDAFQRSSHADAAADQ